MTTWNCRVFKETTEHGDFYSIKEVYYNKNGNPASRTVEDASACGDDIEEIRRSLKRMQKALDLPVLTKMDFVAS